MGEWLEACQDLSKHLGLLQQDDLAMIEQIQHVYSHEKRLEVQVQSLEK